MRGSEGYLAAIHRHFWPELTPSFKDLPVPGPEAHGLLGGGLPGALLPHGHVKAVDGYVLCHFRAQQVQEIHLDPADGELDLGRRHRSEGGQAPRIPRFSLEDAEISPFLLSISQTRTHLKDREIEVCVRWSTGVTRKGRNWVLPDVRVRAARGLMQTDPQTLLHRREVGSLELSGDAEAQSRRRARLRLRGSWSAEGMKRALPICSEPQDPWGGGGWGGALLGMADLTTSIRTGFLASRVVVGFP